MASSLTERRPDRIDPPPMRRGTIFVVPMLLMTPTSGFTQKKPPRLPDPGFLSEITRTHNYTLGRPFAFTFTPDGETLLFLRSGGEDPDTRLWALDLKSQEEREILNTTLLTEEPSETLSPEEQAIRERQRVKIKGITGFTLSADGRRAVFKLGSEVWIWDRPTDRAAKLQLPNGPILHPALSPDAKRLAFVHHDNLYVMRLGSIPAPSSAEQGPPILTGRIRILTRDGDPDHPRGQPEFVAQEEMDRHTGFWWSPDSKWLAYQANDYSAMERFAIANPAAPETEPLRFAYPRPGKANADVKLFIVNVKGKKRREIRWDHHRYPYLARVTWADGAPLSLLVQSRNQREQAYLRFEAQTGRTLPMHQESDSAWLNLAKTTPCWLENRPAYLWATEEGGAWRLERHTPYLSSRKHGLKEKVVLLDESSGYRRLVHIDETHDRLWFIGGRDPTQSTLFVTTLSKSGPIHAISPEAPGMYDAIFADDGDRFVLLHQGLTSLPRATVHRILDNPATEPPAEPRPPLPRLGATAGMAIHDVAQTPSALPRVEILAPREDTGAYAFVVRPSDFSSKRRYPVILHIYGGPHHKVVRHDATLFFILQWVADHGFVVVGLDGRGTPDRGRAWERAIQGDFVTIPLEDQVRGLRELGSRLPELDMERVGIFGWSFGGYMTAMAVLKHPEVFRVGVSGAPVTDWHYYDTHYTERYLDLLDEAPEAYARSSAVAAAEALSRPLLLVHGVADDNVYFAHTLKLADALLLAGKDFDVLPLASSTHQVADPKVREVLYERIVRFLGEVLW